MAKYINNKDLLREVIKVRENKAARPDDPPGSWVTTQMADYIYVLVENYSKRGNWRNYSYIDEMKSQAMLDLVSVCAKFDPNRGSNPFAYFTTIAKNGFLKVLSKEKSLSIYRSDMMAESGMNQSWNEQAAIDIKMAESLENKIK